MKESRRVKIIVGERQSGKTHKLKEELVESGVDPKDILVIVPTFQFGEVCGYKALYDVGTPRSIPRGKRPKIVAFDELFGFTSSVTLRDYLKFDIIPMMPRDIYFTCPYELYGKLRKLVNKLIEGDPTMSVITEFLDLPVKRLTESAQGQMKKDFITGEDSWVHGK